jgi:gliding motility-associated-like protein
MNSQTVLDTLKTISLCDSIVTTVLTINNAVNVANPITICTGDSIRVGSKIYFTAGTYVDTLLSSAGCDSIITSILTVLPKINSSIDSVNDLCENSTPIFLTATPLGGTWGGNGVNPVTGEFDPTIAGSGTQIITYTPLGVCPSIDSFSIVVFPSPLINYTFEDEECDKSDGSIDISITNGTPGYTYSWNTGDLTEDLTGLKQGIYGVTVTDSKNCKSTESISIINEVRDDCKYIAYVANIFSPDGNGENDVLYVQGSGIETLTFKIFNRWGNLVFESTNKTYGWNGEFKGEEVVVGAFVYFIEGTFINGETFDQKGTVTLIR